MQANRLAGKTALVTGAASGIGLASAIRLAEEGAAVLLADIQSAAADQAAARLRESGHKAVAVAMDVTSSDQVRAGVETAVREFGRLDILFANAGLGSSVDLAEATESDWDRVVGVNAKGVFLCCREAIRQMLRQEPPGGSIVINGSISSLAGIPGQGVYAPSKGAVVQMTRQLAVEYATRAIRVNCVCPGTIDTPMLRGAMQASADPEGFLAMLLSGHPMDRMGRPEEIAAAVAFLASDDASFITGAILPVDGGYTAQ